jgi:type I restriction enzyme S subunit
VRLQVWGRMSNKTEGKTMKPVVKRPLVPKLRFPAFRDAGGWKIIPLNKLAKRCTQKNRDGEIKRVLTNSAEFGVLDQRDYFDKDIATQGNLESYFIVEKGDYVYNPRISATAPVGPISKNNIATGVMSPLYTVFRFTNGDNDFYAYYLKSTGWHRYMRKASSTGARHDRMAITIDDFMAMPVPVASSEKEQQKIAHCLASIDELIALEAQKLDTLRTNKKGLAQQLFPNDGASLPKLRFPEFRDAEEWEEKLLGEIATFAKGKGISKADISQNGSLPCIRYGELYTHYAETINSVISYTNVSPDDLVLSQANDVIIPASGETQIDIATASCVMQSGVALGGDLNIIRVNMNGVFLSYYLNNAKKKAISELAQGISVVHLYPSQLKTLSINVPGLLEQQKIADCLSSIDKLISAQAQKLDALKCHKWGLIQQLFPALDEVNG